MAGDVKTVAFGSAEAAPSPAVAAAAAAAVAAWSASGLRRVGEAAVNRLSCAKRSVTFSVLSLSSAMAAWVMRALLMAARGEPRGALLRPCGRPRALRRLLLLLQISPTSSPRRTWPRGLR